MAHEKSDILKELRFKHFRYYCHFVSDCNFFWYDSGRHTGQTSFIDVLHSCPLSYLEAWPSCSGSCSLQSGCPLRFCVTAEPPVSVQCCLPNTGTRAMARSLPAVVSRRSAGGAGETQMTSTWCSRWPKPVPRTPDPAAASCRPGALLETLPAGLASRMWSSVSCSLHL